MVARVAGVGDGPVVIVSDENHLPYDRPPLSKVVLYDAAKGHGDVALRTAHV